MSEISFVQARHFRKGGNLPITRIVVHDEEHPFSDRSAEGVARMFSTTDRAASAHYCVDADSVVQCVLDVDVAYHAPPNSHSIGIERDGYATFTRAQWLSEYGTRAGLRQAQLVAELCVRYGVPPRRLTVDQVAAGEKGLCGHVDVSHAFHQTTHTDPGPGFPWPEFLEVTQDAYRRLTGQQEDDDMRKAWIMQADDPIVDPDDLYLVSGDLQLKRKIFTDKELADLRTLAAESGLELLNGGATRKVSKALLDRIPMV